MMPPTARVSNMAEMQSRPASAVVGARLLHRWNAWKGVTSLRWVRQMMKAGLKLDFKQGPPAPSPPRHRDVSEEDLCFLRTEVAKLRSRGAVRDLLPEEVSTACFSRLFVVHKEGSED